MSSPRYCFLSGQRFAQPVRSTTIAPECALANEAGLPYAAVAMSTDYDCWKEDEEPVTWAQIVEIFEQNVEKVVSLLVATIAKMREEAD